MTPSELVPVDDPDSAVGGGWFIEVNGKRVAELTEPMYVMGSQFWHSYVIVPLTDNPLEREDLFTKTFWDRNPVFRSRKFGVVAPLRSLRWQDRTRIQNESWSEVFTLS
jgi:hypothetical protein